MKYFMAGVGLLVFGVQFLFSSQLAFSLWERLSSRDDQG